MLDTEIRMIHIEIFSDSQEMDVDGEEKNVLRKTEKSYINNITLSMAQST